MYSVKRCSYPARKGPFLTGWIIDHPDNYPYYVNKYLHVKALNSSNTAKQYAYKLCAFLNYLEKWFGIDYLHADVNHLKRFFRFIEYKNNDDITDISEYSCSVATLEAYSWAIKGLYGFLKGQLSDEDEASIKKLVGTDLPQNLYDFNWKSAKPQFLIVDDFHKGKDPVNYIKWYSEEEKKSIMSNFSTTRDKAIFSMSFDGLRIDEILSSQCDRYDRFDGTIKLYRSKGKKSGSDETRLCVLSEESRQYLEDYLYSERSIVEQDFNQEGIIISNYIFVNLKKNSKSYGKPVQYNSFLKILKCAASRAGLDRDRIRTHSGRSTQAAALFRQQSQDPKSITDNQILEIMGWSSMKSANPYKNRQDKETTINTAKILQREKDKRHQ